MSRFSKSVLIEQQQQKTPQPPSTHTKLVFCTVNYKIARLSDQSYNMETQKKSYTVH